jgi:hypothetical protein
MEFLWVRWFDRDISYAAGWQAKRLHQLSFFPCDHPSAFGFIDPKDIVRGVHLIPSFGLGKTKGLLPPSVGHYGSRRPDTNDKDWEDEDSPPDQNTELGEHEDWQYYYVNM